MGLVTSVVLIVVYLGVRKLTALLSKQPENPSHWLKSCECDATNARQLEIHSMERLSY